MSLCPRNKITFVLADTYSSYMRLVHENKSVPYSKRIVQIELTPEQMEKIKPKFIGKKGKEEIFEEILECWLEPVEETKPEAGEEGE